MTKNNERNAKFKKLGAAISALNKKNWIECDYHTGKESEFYLARGDQGNREGYRVTIPCGPQFKTPQWMRTVPKSK